MGYEELSLSSFVKEMKEVSDGAHPRKFCFVLGAGASKASGIKSGQELVNIWDRELRERNKEAYLKWKEALNINDKNKYEFYSQYYERRFRQPEDGYNYLEKLMESAKPSIGYIMLCYILTHTKHHVVITTNFDHLVEDTVNYYEDTIPLVIGHESLAHYVTKQINRPMIIKIHRDLLLDPRNRAAEVNELHDNWKKALDIVFSEYHPVFIGYAGNDNSLMDFLIENREKYLKKDWALPYWMLYRTDEMSEKVQTFLDETNGYLIRHNGFDDVFCMLGAAFEYKLPTKETFLSDAERRFQMLTDSINAYTKASIDRKEAASDENDCGEEAQEVNQAVCQITDQSEQQRLFREALLLDNDGKCEEAARIFKQLIEKNTDNVSYHYCYGINLFKMERYEESSEEMKKAAELEPGNADCQFSYGLTLYRMKHYDKAVKKMREAIEMNPEMAEWHFLYENALREAGNHEEALEEIRKAVELEPGNAEYRYTFGIVLKILERYEEAEKEIRKAVELEPGNAEYRYLFGIVLKCLDRDEEAEKEIRKAIELEPENAEYYSVLTIFLGILGRYEEALNTGEKAVELEPDNAKYHYDVGRSLQALGRCEEALEAKRRAVELEPGNALYHGAMSNQLLILRRCNEALEEARKAVELEPKNAQYRNELGLAFMGLGREKEAEREIRKAIRLKPDNAAYHLQLGIVLHFMGRNEEAKKEMRRAIKMESKNQIYKEMFVELWHIQP
ncbi:MAG: tetratricopeptide repeat protein [Lachnospiraceae bacterium]|nr:tetratricopeptide repeat protein [Lachnospiraceae bacterium]